MTWRTGFDFSIPDSWRTGTDFIPGGGVTGQASAVLNVATYALGQAVAAVEVVAYASGQASAGLAISVSESGQSSGSWRDGYDFTLVDGWRTGTDFEFGVSSTGQASAALHIIAFALGQASAGLEVQVVDIVDTGQASAGLSIVTYALGQASAGLAVQVAALGQASATLAVEVYTTDTAVSRARLAAAVFAAGQASAGLAVDVVTPSYSASARLSVSTYLGGAGAGVASARLAVSVFQGGYAGEPGLIDTSGTWGLAVFLDGADVSANVTGALFTDAEESAAHIAEFTLKPALGPVSLSAWVGVPVAIDYVKRDAAGAELFRYPLFRGAVDVPRYDVATRLTTFACTDQLQRRFEGADRAEIDAVVGGYWSNAIFDEDADNWTYAQDRMSSQPYALDLDLNGALVKTSWAAKGTPDIQFTQSTIVAESLSVDLADSRGIANQVKIAFQYRYELSRERRVHYRWEDYRIISCDYLRYGWASPGFQMVLDAVQGSSWVFYGQPQFTSLPRTTDSFCGSQSWRFVNGTAEAITRAEFTAALKFLQTVTETHDVTVSAPQSIEQFGPLPETATYSLTADYENNLAADTDTVDLEGTYRANLGGGTVQNEFSYRSYKSHLAGAGVGDFSATLDHLASDGDRNDFKAALVAAQHVAKTAILKSHRGNGVSWQCLLAPTVTRAMTLRVDTPEVKASGKVRRVRHEFDIGSGSALTALDIAISKVDAVGIPAETPITDPAPASPATVSDDFEPYVQLKTYRGGRATSPPFDEETMFGWITNWGFLEPGAEMYSQEFRINFPGVDDGNTQAQEIMRESTVTVEIPDEELLLEA